MGLKDLVIKKSYISCGDDNLVDSLIGPALRTSNVYKRCAGFFSSSVFTNIANDIFNITLVVRKA